MLFLLRIVFWIMLICLLLPGSREDSRRLVTSAQRTVSDVRGFCQRNPEVCEDARVTMTSMMSKLKYGAELVQTWIAKDARRGGEGDRSQEAPLPESPQPSAFPPAALEPEPPVRLVPKWQNSLNSADKEVPWHDPARL